MSAINGLHVGLLLLAAAALVAWLIATGPDRKP